MRRLAQISIILLMAIWLASGSAVFASDVFYAAGRGTKNNGTVWKYKDGKWMVYSVIPNCSELFALAVDKEGNLWAGGSHFDYGVVWRYANNKWSNSMRLPGAHAVYALKVDKNGALLAGGAGSKNIWRYNGRQWDSGVKLKDCRVIYSIVGASKNVLWAGGEGKRQLWKYNGKQWDSGIKLNGCKDVFALCEDTQGTIWAGGEGDNAIWKYFYQKNRFYGIILLDSTEVSAFAIDRHNFLCAAGAGRNKIWVKQEKDNWATANLEDCIAVYAISAGKNVIAAGGWNLKRRGRMWIRKNNVWSKGSDLKDCYVVRALAYTNE